MWAVARAGADALFSATEEYVARGCLERPWREIPTPRWLAACPMHIDSRDHYECMIILHLERHNVG